MGRSQDTFNKKEVRNKQEKKRKEKEKKRLAKRETDKKGGMDDMIAYVDEFGRLSETAPDPSQKQVINAEDIETGVPKRNNEPLDPIRTGTVTFFNDSKGYGFIRDSETKESVFVHAVNLLEDITEGNLVRFEVEMGPKGIAAVRVSIKK
ncbi:MAG: cold shock domain-containing protein [Clostridia bacterium]|nr:cold shock domain-containing protein [Clostridia bacterium]